MKKNLWTVFSMVWLFCFLSCKNKSYLSTANKGRSLLWEISGKGLNEPSYFFGTMHLMCAEDAELTETIKAVIRDVEQIYLEVDLDNASELLSGLLDLRSKQGLTLNKALSPDDYNKVKQFFEKYQPTVPFAMLERQPPLMISSMLFELLLPCEQKNGIELKIIDEAYKENKETKGLETLEFQASIFDSIPYTEQANELVKAIDSLEKSRTLMNEMIAAYKDQDIDKLFTLSFNEESGINKYMDLLLYRRNQNWVNQFPALANNCTLFAVGAGHLGGDKGVLQMLREHGYTVRAINN